MDSLLPKCPWGAGQCAKRTVFEIAVDLAGCPTIPMIESGGEHDCSPMWSESGFDAASPVLTQLGAALAECDRVEVFGGPIYQVLPDTSRCCGDTRGLVSRARAERGQVRHKESRERDRS